MTRQRSLSRPRGRSPPTSSQRDRHKTRESSMSRSPVRHPTKTANGDDVDADIAVRPLPKYSRPSSPLAEKVSVGKEETARKSVKGSALSGSLARSRTRSPSPSRGRQRARSRSRSRSSRSYYSSRSMSRSRSRSISRSRSRSVSRSRSRSVSRSRSRSYSTRSSYSYRSGSRRTFSRSRSRSYSRSRSRSWSRSPRTRFRQRSRSRSRSPFARRSFRRSKSPPRTTGYGNRRRRSRSPLPPLRKPLIKTVTVYPLTNNVEKAHVREILTYFGDVVRVDLQRVRGGSANGDGGLKIAGIATTSSENDHDNGTGDLKNTPHQKAIVEMSTVKDADEVVHGMHNGMIDGLTINVVMLTAVENENRFKGISGSNMDRAGGNQGGSDRGRSRMMDSRLPARNGRGRIGFNSMREDRRPFQRSGARSRSRSISRSPSRKRLAEGGRRDPVRGRFRSPPRRDVRKWSPSRR
ncbi:hypothetical protein BDV3_000363 [Batrachochytrium dendrobatidis]|nr:hypothetical protein O5D80_000544 [Batrachochytrium dendrobatidis]KAK5672090.1 hypothetical protein QVD99_001902 [Batrachochytrium dendrobatidis]